MIQAESVSPWGKPVPKDANAFFVAEGNLSGLHARFCGGRSSPGDPVCFQLVGDPLPLARRPERIRFRYEVSRWP
jgi:hypothetical protein